MIVSHCPHCHEPFRVASGDLPEDAYAQCPWCHETFPAADLLERLPPLLAVFSADGQPLTPAEQVATAGLAASGFGGPAGFELDTGEPQDLTVTEDTVTEEPDWPDRSSFEGGRIQFRDEQTEGETPGMAVAGAPRRKKSKGSGLRSAIGVVLGGLMAIPIAGLLLMALGKTPDWGFWPFNGQAANATPNRSASAPLPDRTSRTRAPRRLATGESSGLTAGLDPALSALEQITADEDPSELLADTDMDASSEPVDLVEIADPLEGTIEIDAADVENVTSDNTPTVSVPDADKQVMLAPLKSTSEGTGDVAAASATESGTSTAEVVEDATAVVAADAEVMALLRAAGDSVDSLASFEGNEKDRRRQLAQTYSKIATACEAASSGSAELRALAAQIAESPILKDVGYAGNEWLRFSGRKTNGIALVGKPTGGDEPTLTLESGKVVSLITDGELPDSDSILALGRITDDESAVEIIVAQPLP